MKNCLLLSTCFLSFALGFSQVGIGTTSPQQDLHISGSNSTIRIESLNSNNVFNDGAKPAPAFVDINGDITIGNGTGTPGQVPLNFLEDRANFVTDNPYNLSGTGWITQTGSVVNNGIGIPEAIGEITTLVLNVPQDAIIEVKYGITLMIIGSDLLAGPPYYYVTLDQTVAVQTYFKVDLNSNGWDGDEDTRIYGRKAQHYVTNNQGIVGYPYMNGQAFLTLPAGSHTLYFYGQINDHEDGYTSVGFGGAQDYLKIRVYN